MQLLLICLFTALFPQQQKKQSAPLPAKLMVRMHEYQRPNEDSSYYFQVVEFKGRKEKLVYQITDAAVEFRKEYHYKDGQHNYTYFSEYDLPTGIQWAVFYNHQDGKVYRSICFDNSAVGDKVLRKSVNFNKGTFLALQTIPTRKVYAVKLKVFNLSTDTIFNNRTPCAY